jgi:hypothetical protein
MIKLLVRLAIAAVIANVGVRLGSAYLVHVQFRDTVRQEITRVADERELQQRVLDVAEAFEVPQDAEAFTVRREPREVFAEGEYEKRIMVVPGFSFPWTFAWEINAYLPGQGPDS